MTANSELGYFARFQSTYLMQTDEPLSVGVARYSIFGNLVHLHDEAGQILVNDAQTNIDGIDGRWRAFGTAQGEFHYYGPHGPFPLRRRANGKPFKLVIRLGGVWTGTGTAEIKVQIVPAHNDVSFVSSYPTHIFTVTNTETVLGDTLLEMDLRFPLVDLPTLTEDGGDPEPVIVTIARMDIWASHDTVSSSEDFSLTSVFVREYVG